jgi:hypothetical protein
MPRRKRGEKGKPWLRKLSNGTLRWYMPKGATGGKLVPITRKDDTFIDGKEAESDAIQAWHAWMASAQAPEKGEDNEVRLVLDLYLQHVQKHASKKTLDAYVGFFRSFRDQWPGLLVRHLWPLHVDQWWEQCHRTWGPSTRLYSATALQAALNWAAGTQGGLIPKNPLKGMKMPRGRSRGADALIDDDDHKKLLAAVPDDLRDVLITLRHTGTRPSTVSRVTASEFDAEQGTWRLDPERHKSGKKTGMPLVVLPPALVELCKRLALKHPQGPLFRTKKGEPWYAAKLASRILWYKKKLQVKVIAYGYRHNLATDLLEQGVADAQVAATRDGDGCWQEDGFAARSYGPRSKRAIEGWLLRTYSADRLTDLPPVTQDADLLSLHQARQKAARTLKGGVPEVVFPCRLEFQKVSAHRALKESAFIFETPEPRAAVLKQVQKFESRTGAGLELLALRRRYGGRRQGSLADLAEELYRYIQRGGANVAKHLNLNKLPARLSDLAGRRRAELAKRKCEPRPSWGPGST